MLNEELQRFITKSNKLIIQALNNNDIAEAQRLGVISVRKLKNDAYIKSQGKVTDEISKTISDYMTSYVKSGYAPTGFNKDLYTFDIDDVAFSLSKTQTAMYDYLGSAYISDFNKLYTAVKSLEAEGLITRQQAIRQVTKKYKGPTVRFKDGKNYPASTYFETILQDNLSNISRNIGKDLGNKLGTDIYVYSSRTPAKEPRVSCMGLYNKPVAYTDVPEGFTDFYDNKHKVENLYNHGYGTPAGPLGVRCAHDIYPAVQNKTIL